MQPAVPKSQEALNLGDREELKEVTCVAAGCFVSWGPSKSQCLGFMPLFPKGAVLRKHLQVGPRF